MKLSKDERIGYFMGFFTGILFAVMFIKLFDLGMYFVMPLEIVLLMLFS